MDEVSHVVKRLAVRGVEGGRLGVGQRERRHPLHQLPQLLAHRKAGLGVFGRHDEGAELDGRRAQEFAGQLPIERLVTLGQLDITPPGHGQKGPDHLADRCRQAFVRLGDGAQPRRSLRLLSFLVPGEGGEKRVVCGADRPEQRELRLHGEAALSARDRGEDPGEAAPEPAHRSSGGASDRASGRP